LSHNDVPRFIDKLDVALIPFKINDLTQCSFPIKLLEYFARGKPVVSSPLIEVMELARDLLYIASSEEEWIRAIESALNEEDELRIRRIELSKNYTWEKIANTYQDLLTKII
jgi:glycosyltransferase involved in cell wall biosynthesis